MVHSAPIGELSDVDAVGRPNRWDRPNLWYALVVAISLLVAVPVFARLTLPSAHTDIMHHAELAKRIVEGGGWISYSLWYPLVYVLSAGATVERYMRLASVGLLSVMVAAKSVLVYWAALRALGSRMLAIGISLSLLVIMPLLDPSRPKHIYLGQIAPNVWHNSTTILAAPFAIAAFLAAVSMLRLLSIKSAAIFSLLIVLATLAKPNYSLAFLPVLGIVVLVVLARERIGWGRSIAIIAVAFVPVVIALAFQYVFVYTGTIVTSTRPTIDPFAVWTAFSPNIPLSLVLSLAGPLLVFFAMNPARRRTPTVVLAWASLLLAMVQAAVLSEENPGGGIALDGNWFWGAYTAMLVVFLVSFLEFARLLRVEGISRERWVVIVVAGLALLWHVCSGIYYVLNIGVGSYPSY